MKFQLGQDYQSPLQDSVQDSTHGSDSISGACLLYICKFIAKHADIARPYDILEKSQQVLITILTSTTARASRKLSKMYSPYSLHIPYGDADQT
jgi:hypothetical protein